MKSCCPECLRILDASKEVEGKYVYLKRTCPEHGEIKTLVSKDSKRFFDKTFTSSGKDVYERQTETEKGCPEDCGWCPEHKQHLCSSLIEITGKCNLKCPVCYFGQFNQADISLDEFKSRLNTVMRTENGVLDVLQISGGEPLLHKDFIALLEFAYTQNVNRILINTNGLLFLEKEKLYNKIKELKDKVEIYLQFDGFNNAVYEKLRGRPLAGVKREIVNKLNRDDIKICLAVTVIKDNLKELKDIVEFAAKTRNITGITFQRFTKVGNGYKFDADAIVQEDILQSIDDTKYLRYENIVPLPCSHENCTSISFLFVDGNRKYSMSEFVDYAKHQQIIRNRIGFPSDILEYIKNNVSCESGCCSWVQKQLPQVKRLMQFVDGGGSNFEDMKILRIVVKNFMDSYTFDSERAQKCCVGVSAGNNKIIPFCVNNIFKRGYSDAL